MSGIPVEFLGDDFCIIFILLSHLSSALSLTPYPIHSKDSFVLDVCFLREFFDFGSIRLSKEASICGSPLQRIKICYFSCILKKAGPKCDSDKHWKDLKRVKT